MSYHFLQFDNACNNIHCDSLDPTACRIIIRQTPAGRHIRFTTTQIYCSCVRTYTPVFLTKSTGPSCHAAVARLFHTCIMPKNPSSSTTDARHTRYTSTQHIFMLASLGRYSRSREPSSPFMISMVFRSRSGTLLRTSGKKKQCKKTTGADCTDTLKYGDSNNKDLENEDERIEERKSKLRIAAL